MKTNETITHEYTTSLSDNSLYLLDQISKLEAWCHRLEAQLKSVYESLYRYLFK